MASRGDGDGLKSAPTNGKVEEKHPPSKTEGWGTPRGRAGETPAPRGSGEGRRMVVTRGGSWPDLRRGDSIAGRLGSL